MDGWIEWGWDGGVVVRGRKGGGGGLLGNERIPLIDLVSSVSSNFALLCRLLVLGLCQGIEEFSKKIIKKKMCRLLFFF